MKIGLYSCITKGYETEPPTIYDRHIFDFMYLYTDDFFNNSKFWEIKPLATPNNIFRNDHINRYHKFFAEKLLTKCDISIYIDGNIDIKSDIQSLINIFYLSGASIGFFKHPQRTSILQEANACIRLKKFKEDDLKLLNQQLSFYDKQNISHNYQLLSAGIIFRRHNHNKDLNKAMLEWWNQINLFTGRDQLSLPYILWKFNLPYFVFDLDIFNNPYFERKPHKIKRRFFTNLLKKMKKW